MQGKSTVLHYTVDTAIASVRAINAAGSRELGNMITAVSKQDNRYDKGACNMFGFPLHSTRSTTAAKNNRLERCTYGHYFYVFVVGFCASSVLRKHRRGLRQE